MRPIPWINREEALPSPINNPDPDPRFPGLIAASNELNVKRLIEAYQQGIFPWYSEGEPILWWCTNPRMVLYTNEFKVSRSLKKFIQKFINDSDCEIRVNCNFLNVINACASKLRPGQNGTWITSEIINAYYDLHKLGHAHSIETWYKNQLVGGLYCVNFGEMAFGESMFSDKPNSSKVALATLCAWATSNKIAMIDCQQETEHLRSLGARPIAREAFLNCVAKCRSKPQPDWNFGKEFLNYWL